MEKTLSSEQVKPNSSAATKELWEDLADAAVEDTVPLCSLNQVFVIRVETYPPSSKVNIFEVKCQDIRASLEAFGNNCCGSYK